jgi:hypothetical protein
LPTLLDNLGCAAISWFGQVGLPQAVSDFVAQTFVQYLRNFGG